MNIFHIIKMIKEVFKLYIHTVLACAWITGHMVFFFMNEEKAATFPQYPRLYAPIIWLVIGWLFTKLREIVVPGLVFFRMENGIVPAIVVGYGQATGYGVCMWLTKIYLPTVFQSMVAYVQIFSIYQMTVFIFAIYIFVLSVFDNEIKDFI